MHIVPVYAAVLALLFVFLSFRTVRLRRRLRIAIGHGDDKALLRAMRVHANFAEYAPLALLLSFFVEIGGAAPLLVHGLASALLLGRSAHAYGVSQSREKYAFRVTGMVLTFTSLLGASAWLLFAQAVRLGA